MSAASARETDEHPFAPVVRILGKGKKGSRSLSREEARTAMGMILDGEVLDLQLGAFLMLLRVKEETPEELAGFVDAAQARLNPPATLRADIDWSSYAGKRRQPPWFLLALKVLADHGLRVVIHGAEGHTIGRVYTREVAAGLGIPIADNWDGASAALQQQGLAYLPLDVLSPRLEAIIQMRSVLGLRSPVHSMARLLNPLRAPLVMQGIFHPPYAPLHQSAGRLLDYARTLVIKGEGGEIERNPDALCKLHLADAQGERVETWPALFDQRHPVAEDLGPEALRALWEGRETNAYGEAAVIGTLAVVLRGLDRATDPEEAHTLARRWWEERPR